MNAKEFQKEYGVKPSQKCISCCEKAKDIVETEGDDYSVKDGQWTEDSWVCGRCYESDRSEPCATVI